MPAQAIEIVKEIFFRNRDRHAIPSMDGALNPNDALDRLPMVKASVKDPDDLVFDATGNLYVSTENRVLKLSGKEYREEAVFVEFEGPTGGLGFHPDGRLMVCIGGVGLCLVDDAGRTTWIKEAQTSRILCPNSAVARADGTIYITDGSLHHEPSDRIWDLMEKRASGRLIRYDPATEKFEVLLSGLGYPWGIEISLDQQWIMFSESWHHTVSRCPIDDIRPATREVVIPNLPGYPGRIAAASDGGYWICLFAMRTELVEFVLSEDMFRLEMMRTIDPAHWVRPALSSGKDLLEPIQFGGIRVLGIKKPWAPPRSYGLVVRIDEDFEIKKSLHSRADGRRHGITGLAENKGDLFILSKGHGLILKLKK